jgi:hypothetical protein
MIVLSFLDLVWTRTAYFYLSNLDSGPGLTTNHKLRIHMQTSGVDLQTRLSS